MFRRYFCIAFVLSILGCGEAETKSLGENVKSSNCQQACMDGLEMELESSYMLQVDCADQHWVEPQTCAACTQMLADQYQVQVVEGFCDTFDKK